MEEEKLPRTWPPSLSYDHTILNLDMARKLIAAAVKKSKEVGLNMTMAVCDAGGNLVALERMDDAALLSIEIAQNKAKTAVFGKIPSLLWGMPYRGADPELIPLHFHSDWITFIGGFPIIFGDKIAGGLGSSGATWEDGIICRAALAEIGADISGVEECLKLKCVPECQW